MALMRWMFTNQGDKVQIEKGDDTSEIEEYYAGMHNDHDMRFEIEDHRLGDAFDYLGHECVLEDRDIAARNFKDIDENLIKRLEDEEMPCTTYKWKRVSELLKLRFEEIEARARRAELDRLNKQRRIEEIVQQGIHEAQEEESSDPDQSEDGTSEDEPSGVVGMQPKVGNSNIRVPTSSDLTAHAPTNTQPVPASSILNSLPGSRPLSENVPKSAAPPVVGGSWCTICLGEPMPWRPHKTPSHDPRDAHKEAHRCYEYGTHVSTPEVWYINAPKALPFPETVALQDWESLRIQHEMKNKLSKEPCVDTDIPFGHPRLSKYLELKQFETGSRFTMPAICPELKEDVEMLNEPSDMAALIKNIGSEPAEAPGGTVPPIFLDKFEFNPEMIHKVDARKIIQEILGPKNKSPSNYLPPSVSSEEIVEPRPSNYNNATDTVEDTFNQLRKEHNTTPTPNIRRPRKKTDFAPAFESARRRSASRASPDEPEIGSDFEDTVIVNTPSRSLTTPRRSQRNARGGAVARRMSVERAKAIRTSPPQQSATPTRPTPRNTGLTPEQQLTQRGFAPAVARKPDEKKTTPVPSGPRSRKRKHEAENSFSVYVDKFPDVNPTQTNAHTATLGPANKRRRMRTPEPDEDFSLYEDAPLAPPAPTPTSRRTAGKRKRNSPRNEDEEYTPEGQRRESAGSGEYVPPKTGLRGHEEENDGDAEGPVSAKRRKVKKTVEAREEKEGEKSGRSVSSTRRSPRNQRK